MDGFNWTVFGLVLAPTMVALLPRAGIEPSAANIGWYGQISAAIFLLGWGCSAIWGPIADRFGRMPAMTASILLYGVFTALAGTATNMWEWNGYRFVAAIGIGGEWAMAGTLLAEILPERVRARFGGAMHSAAYFGVLAVSALYLVAGPQLGWRGMFFIGGIPALAVFLIRRATPEPERWQHHSDEVRRQSFWQPVIDILTPPYRARTLGNLLLLAVCVIGLWAGSTYVPTAMTTLAEHAGYGHDATVRLAGISAMTVAVFTIAGCFVVPRLADRFGRRRTLASLFGLLAIGTVGTYGVAYPLQSIALTFVFLPDPWIRRGQLRRLHHLAARAIPNPHARHRIRLHHDALALGRRDRNLPHRLRHPRHGIADRAHQPHRRGVPLGHRRGARGTRDPRAGSARLDLSQRPLTVGPSFNRADGHNASAAPVVWSKPSSLSAQHL